MGILDLLAGGDRRSTGESRRAAAMAMENPALIGELIGGVACHDKIVRSRSAHALMLICERDPSLLHPHKNGLRAAMAPQKQWEVREQFCKIFPALDLDEGDVAQAIEIFRDYLDAEHSIVRTCALQGLKDLIRFDSSLEPQVRNLLGHYAQAGTAAMRARCRILLKEMN